MVSSAAAGAPTLEVRGLTLRRRGNVILSVESLRVDRGETLAILGPNGAGKTTLLHLLALLEKPSEGKLFFGGEMIDFRRDLTGLRRRMGVALQQPYLFDASVFDNVAVGLKFRRAGREEIRRRTFEAMELLRISHLSARPARMLSAGEAARVNLARAFTVKPELLLLDEPFSSLDKPSREALLEDLEKLLRYGGAATIFSTHDSSEALRLANRVAVMNQGRIIQCGLTEEVMNFPASEVVAELVGVETVLAGRVVEASGGVMTVAVRGKWKVEATGSDVAGEEVILCIRPENVTLSTAPVEPRGISTRNIFRGVVRKVIPMGHYFKVMLDCGFPLASSVTGYSVESLGLKEGREVTAAFKATAIHVIHKGPR